MKGFARKASISEMVSLGEGREQAVGVKVFLVEDYREEVLVIKDEVGSVYGFRGITQKRGLIDVKIGRGRGAKFEVEEVEVRVSGSSKEKLLVTGTEGTTGVVIVGEEARGGNEERVIAVEEIIVLDEGTSGVGEEEL